MDIPVTHADIIQLQSGDFSPIPIKMPVFQPCAFVVSLTFYFLLEIDNIPRKSIGLRFRPSIYPIIYVFLSISAQLFCKVKLLSFWVHLNVIPTFVIIKNLSWPPIFQDIITNHAFGCNISIQPLPLDLFYWDNKLSMEVYDIIPYPN